jgi:hypothetical protein
LDLFLQVLVFIVLFLCRFGNDGNPKSFGSTDDNFLGTGTVVGYVVVPSCHFDADADPDPSFYFYPDPDPSFQIKAYKL